MGQRDTRQHPTFDPSGCNFYCEDPVHCTTILTTLETADAVLADVREAFHSLHWVPCQVMRAEQSALQWVQQNTRVGFYKHGQIHRAARPTGAALASYTVWRVHVRWERPTEPGEIR